MNQILILAGEIKQRRLHIEQPPPSDKNLAKWVEDCFLEFHGVNGIAIARDLELWKDLKLIAKARVYNKQITLTIYRDGKEFAMLTSDPAWFVKILAEGMSYFI